LAWVAAKNAKETVAAQLSKGVEGCTQKANNGSNKLNKNVLASLNRCIASGAVPVTAGLVSLAIEFDLTDLPSYLFAVPLPEIEAARLLSWKPTLVYACLGMDYTSARMVEALGACRRESVEKLLELLVELVEVHGKASAAELRKAKIPPLEAVCRFLGVLLDARHLDLCLAAEGSQMQRLMKAVSQHVDRLGSAEAVLGTVHALQQPYARAPDERMMDLWFLPI
jgi:hypothetical protein